MNESSMCTPIIHNYLVFDVGFIEIDIPLGIHMFVMLDILSGISKMKTKDGKNERDALHQQHKLD